MSRPVEPETAVSPNEVEIERKFLVMAENLPKCIKLQAHKVEILQTYINYSPEIRVRHVDGQYFFTLKRPLDETGLTRQEIQFQITKEEYDELTAKQVGSPISKIRYQYCFGDTVVYVDVYQGSLAGLVVAEVEFPTVRDADAFVPLDWFGPEVTSDKRYKNANLAKSGLPDAI